MANLPARTNQSSPPAEPYKPKPIEKLIVKRLVAGGNPTSIAKELAEKVGRRGIPTWRYHVVKTIGRSEWVQDQLRRAAMAEAHAAVPGAVVGLGRRARRGRPDAVKPILEMTGVWNPKMQHEHSGEVKITLDLPRPARVDAEATAEEY